LRESIVFPFAREACRQPGEGGAVPADGEERCERCFPAIPCGLPKTAFAVIINGAADIPEAFGNVSFMSGDCATAARIA